MVRPGRLQPAGVTWDLPDGAAGSGGHHHHSKGERRRRKRGEEGRRSRSARAVKRECKGDVTFNSGVLYITDNSGDLTVSSNTNAVHICFGLSFQIFYLKEIFLYFFGRLMS